MDRRNIFKTALVGWAGILGAKALSSTAARAADTADATPKIVYHLADLEKVNFVLGNIRNHIAGTGGPGKAKIALVVHGPSLKAFRADTPNIGIKEEFREVVGAGVEPYACIHTMSGMKLELKDLLQGFAIAEKGGVVKLAEFQGQGFVYLRP
jgi:intracellular sulfur oxidation DsrE/DsrF family protein